MSYHKPRHQIHIKASLITLIQNEEEGIMNKLLRIFALGGNDVASNGLDPKTGKPVNPDLPSQWRCAARTCKLLAEIIKEHPADHYIVTHGNGPQVGNLLTRAEYALPIMPPIPLDVCVAETEGAMGYMLGQLRSALEIHGIKKRGCNHAYPVSTGSSDSAGFERSPT